MIKTIVKLSKHKQYINNHDIKLIEKQNKKVITEVFELIWTWILRTATATIKYIKHNLKQCLNKFRNYR